MSRVLGIDYGLKRTGIAITDPLRIIASPLTTVKTENILDFLKEIISKELISIIVIGLPKNLDLSYTDSTLHTIEFIKLLKNSFKSLEIVEFDERFTSKIAYTYINNMGLKKTKRKKKELIDQISASIILQSYLTYINN